MGTISNKVIAKLDEKFEKANGETPKFIQAIKESERQVSILSAKTIEPK